MAPRKRTTKQRKNNPKTAKLEAFLEDFDSEGEYVLHTVSIDHRSTLRCVKQGSIDRFTVTNSSSRLTVYCWDPSDLTSGMAYR